jgi:hypothetical protein
MKIIRQGNKFIIDFEGLEVDCGDMNGTNLHITDLLNFDNVLRVENGNFNFLRSGHPLETKV